ncbi:MAG: CCE_0567 family metalloprotein [Synechococcus sp.]
MTTTTTDLSITDPAAIDSLKKQIKRLNSKAGQMKMDLHDIAEGLPTDLELLPEAASRTYLIYCQLRDLRQQLKTLEAQP